MWNKGIITDNENIYKWEAKVYDEPSEFGIKKGRISKLTIWLNGRIAVNYDRRWDIRPKSDEVKNVYMYILRKFK